MQRVGLGCAMEIGQDVGVSEAAVLARLTSICLALPEATSDDRHPPHRGFVVNQKNFAWFMVDEHGDCFEEMGALLLAAEAAAQAGAAFGRAGLRARASQAEARSASLSGQCEGATTPVLRERPELAHLTSREHEVATLAASGLTSKEVAGRLLLSQRTVDNYLQRAYRKLGVRRREELAAVLGLEPRPG